MNEEKKALKSLQFRSGNGEPYVYVMTFKLAYFFSLSLSFAVPIHTYMHTFTRNLASITAVLSSFA
jgi:hypothetical protein